MTPDIISAFILALIIDIKISQESFPILKENRKRDIASFSAYILSIISAVVIFYLITSLESQFTLFGFQLNLYNLMLLPLAFILLGKFYHDITIEINHADNPVIDEPGNFSIYYVITIFTFILERIAIFLSITEDITILLLVSGLSPIISLVFRSIIQKRLSNNTRFGLIFIFFFCLLGINLMLKIFDLEIGVNTLFLILLFSILAELTSFKLFGEK